MLIFFFHSFVIICCLFINILLFEQFFPKHHRIKLFKNPDFVSPILGRKCLQRLSADDKSHWKELNILINYNNCFHILKRPFNLDLIEPLCYIFVKSDLQGYTLFILFFLPRRKRKVLYSLLFCIVIIKGHKHCDRSNKMVHPV